MAVARERTADNRGIKREEPKGLTRNQRWVYGFMLLALAVFTLLAVVSYYFNWADDQSIVRWGMGGNVAHNHAGKLGAWVGEMLVGRTFGVFGIAVPVVLIILAVRIMGFRPMLLRRSVRICIITMILGSLSLGLLLGARWGVFGSGPGGAHGIYVSRWLADKVGTMGVGLLLALSWVLLAVYINRNTINRVNRFGRNIADTGASVGKGAAELLRKVPLPGTPGAGQGGGDDGDEDGKDKPEAVGGTPNAPVGAGERITVDGDEYDFTIVGTGDADDDLIAPWDERPQGATVVGQSEQGGLNGLAVVGGAVAKGDKLGGAFEIVDATRREESGGVIAGSVIDEREQLISARPEGLLDEEEIDTLYDPTLELSTYQRPPVEILEDHSVEVVVTEEEIRENKNQIVRTLENFGIRIDRIKATIGPTVTLYEIVPAPGIRVSKIKNLEDDIALSLSALGIRIIAPMPGQGTVGIEVPNKEKKIVSMYSVIRSPRFQESGFELPIVLGKTIQNETYVIDLAKMPHLLVAGATGQGKSVGLNAIITSLLYKKHPAELKFVLVDPKKVELTLYQKLEKHFLARMEGEDEAIITDTHKVIYTLNSLCKEMDDRYTLLRKAEVRHIKEYNDKFTHRRLSPRNGHRFLPYIVVVIDEFADMIMTAGREIETPIARIAQLARAVGIHLVIATQRPTTNIITGVIKANFPARIAFRVSSMIDSRTIIDQPGANQLIGRGDMLISTGSDMVRVQCAFIDTPEIERVTEFIGRQRGYVEPYDLPLYTPDGDSSSSRDVDLGQTDPMFDEVARFVVQNQQGSTSAVQRRFSIGYNRAGRIMDQIEAAGIVGKPEGGKPREVLITDMTSLEMVLNSMTE